MKIQVKKNVSRYSLIDDMHVPSEVSLFRPFLDSEVGWFTGRQMRAHYTWGTDHSKHLQEYRICINGKTTPKGRRKPLPGTGFALTVSPISSAKTTAKPVLRWKSMWQWRNQGPGLFVCCVKHAESEKLGEVGWDGWEKYVPRNGLWRCHQ